MHTTQNIQSLSESFVNTTSWGFAPINSTSTTVTGCLFTTVTVEMSQPRLPDINQGRTIGDLIAEREKDPRKAAALAKARKKFAQLLTEGSTSLAQLRLSKGMSQQQVADAMGVKQPHVARIEKGEDVKISTARNLARALGVPTSVVIEALENMLSSKELI